MPRVLSNRLVLGDWAERTGRVIEAVCVDERGDLVQRRLHLGDDALGDPPAGAVHGGRVGGRRLVLDPAAEHIVFAAMGEDLAARTVTLMAASKTFNIAGLTCGFAIIPDAGLRSRFRRILQGMSLDQNVFGLAATMRAVPPWFTRSSRCALYDTVTVPWSIHPIPNRCTRKYPKSIIRFRKSATKFPSPPFC